MLTRLLGEGSNVLLENPQLFFFAIERHRPDFVLKFRTVLKDALPFLDKHRVQFVLDAATGKEEPREVDILSYAIAFKDLVSVRAILLCWTEIMNTDIKDTLSQSLYHPGYFFPIEALEPLAKVYPLEYMHFLCAIRLVRNHLSVMSEDSGSKEQSQQAKTLVLSERNRFEIVGTNVRNANYNDTWASYLDKRRSVSRWG